VNYFLTGSAVAEYTLATTTQFYDVRKGEWARGLLEKLGVQTEMLPEVVPPGTVVGKVRADISTEASLAVPPLVVAPACHDTGSAVAAVPAEGGSGWGYISSGTWSLMGIELSKPCVTPEALAGNYTNEGGICGTIRFLKNIMGLWLVQESKRQWAREGHDLDYDALTAMAEKAPALRSVVVPDDPSFFAPGDMPGRIRDYCRETGQPVPGSEGDVVRCALESLALAYRRTAGKIAAITGVRIERLHIVGGGSRNRLLDRFAASALGTPVVTGPVEATAMGNVLMQAMALKDIPDLAALRAVVRASSETESFAPEERGPWDRAYEKYEKLAGDR
jgi:rhamnulokinase